MYKNSKFNPRYQLSLSDTEDLIRELLPALYKGDWTVTNAINGFQKFEKSALIFGQTPWEHWAYFGKLRSQLRRYTSQIEKAKLELNSILNQNKVVKRNLEIFKEEWGVNSQLDRNHRERIRYKAKYEALKKQIESGHPINPGELEKLNKYMINPLGEHQVLDKIEDIRLRPSKYQQLFQKIPSRFPKKQTTHENLFDNIDQENSPTNPENDQ